MNTTKKALIITAIVLNFLNVGWELYLVITGLMQPANIRQPIFYYIFDIFQIIAYIVCNGFLIYSIAAKGAMFRSRYGFYMAAVVISLILNLFSVATILLIVTLFLSDIVWIKPEKDSTFSSSSSQNQNFSNESKEQKIEKLRKLKEEGKITEEEYNDKLLDLL